MTSMMTDPGPRSVHTLRRSTTDRMISGVCGGLGEYFRVDPVIFRVVFGVLSFFGGVGILLYLAGWLLIPEPGTTSTVVDRAIAKFRARHVPPWIVLGALGVILWLGWFSWWAPGPSIPAFVLVIILAAVLLKRQGRSQQVALQPQVGTFERTAETDSEVTQALPEVPPAAASEPFASEPLATEPLTSEPLIPPFDDTRRAMQAWMTEAREAKRVRRQRRRPVLVGALTSLVVTWVILALIDAAIHLPFPVYIWSGLGILGASFLASLVFQRTVWVFTIPLVILGFFAVALGGTKASLADGSGNFGWQPTTAAELTDHTQFAGYSKLDLTKLTSADLPREVTVTQAAGAVSVDLPKDSNTTVIAKVHWGDIRVGDGTATGTHTQGMDVTQVFNPPAGATGAPLTIVIDLTAGHVQINP